MVLLWFRQTEYHFKGTYRYTLFQFYGKTLSFVCADTVMAMTACSVSMDLSLFPPLCLLDPEHAHDTCSSMLGCFKLHLYVPGLLHAWDQWLWDWKDFPHGRLEEIYFLCFLQGNASHIISIHTVTTAQETSCSPLTALVFWQVQYFHPLGSESKVTAMSRRSDVISTKSMKCDLAPETEHICSFFGESSYYLLSHQ